MTRHRVFNEETGRMVFKTGRLGREITRKEKNKKAKKMKKTGNEKIDKYDKHTYIMFHKKSAMKPAEDMLAAGWEPDKVIAICSWKNNMKKVLTVRDDGSAYWSSKRV